MEILDQACEAARTFSPLSETELTTLLSKTARAAAQGEFEPFKTSSIFDGTAHRLDLCAQACWGFAGIVHADGFAHAGFPVLTNLRHHHIGRGLNAARDREWLLQWPGSQGGL